MAKSIEAIPGTKRQEIGSTKPPGNSVNLHIFNDDEATIISIDYDCMPFFHEGFGKNNHQRQIKAFEKWEKYCNGLNAGGMPVPKVESVCFYGVGGNVCPPVGFKSLGIFDKTRLYTYPKVILKDWEDFKAYCQWKCILECERKSILEYQKESISEWLNESISEWEVAFWNGKMK